MIVTGAMPPGGKCFLLMGAMPPSNIPFWALASWILIIGWFGFNVMSAQRLVAVQGLVALNSLMALCAASPASG